jgi:NADPH:quinone reductase-like Zn-dependent oxidoreductase
MTALLATGRPDAMVATAETAMPRPRPDESLVKEEAFSVNRGELP